MGGYFLLLTKQKPRPISPVGENDRQNYKNQSLYR
nr:MAG TPA: hypothetical protein [Caudoviricetes sp.]